MDACERFEASTFERCSTSPILFNVYHQAVMRQAEVARERGVRMQELDGDGCLVDRSRVGRLGEGGEECKTVSLTCALFADYTTIVGMSGEIDE